MAITRSGNTEYEDKEPTFEEKTARLEDRVREELKKDPATLKLNGRYLGNDEILILSRMEQIRSVRVLNLWDNQIGNPALKTLFTSPLLAGVEELDLAVNFITDEGLKEIIELPEWALSSLRVLSLEDNRLSDASGVNLVKASNFNKLDTLNLGWNELGNETARALGETEHLQGLNRLYLERNYINAEGVRFLADGQALKQLQELDLSSNKIGDEGAVLLAASPTFANLRILKLTNNMIGDTGAKALGESKTLSGLTELHMGRNYFGEPGGEALYRSKTLTQLKSLVLREGVETNPDLVNYSRPELLAPPDER